MSAPALPCISCGKPLESVFESLADNLATLPLGGTLFTSHGNFGSAVFDPHDGSYISINICDSCLIQAQVEGRVLFTRRPPPPPPADISLWDGYAPDAPSTSGEAELNMFEFKSVFAPWSPDQVASLNGFQKSGRFHPFACDKGSHPLVATPEGWICLEDDATQSWAYDYMLDGTWRTLDPAW